jgi:hypothetical protein
MVRRGIRGMENNRQSQHPAEHTPGSQRCHDGSCHVPGVVDAGPAQTLRSAVLETLEFPILFQEKIFAVGNIGETEIARSGNMHG